MAEILKGAPVAKALTEKLAAQCEALKNENVIPTLAVLRIGERPDDLVYEKAILKRCEKIGIETRISVFEEDGQPSKILEHIEKLNSDDKVHGILVFRPFPEKYKSLEKEACEILSPSKDVDCMTEKSLAGVFTQNGTGYPPCTAEACVELMDFYGIEIEGKNICVIGRSLVIGKPVSMLLQSRNATVTMCHSRTKNLAEISRNSEIIISAIGKTEFITSEFFSEGQTVIDVGINVNSDGNLCGDVKFSDAEKTVGKITPVPGGVGAVTTAVLAKHVIASALQSQRQNRSQGD